MPKQIFINLPVKDLGKTKDFFTELGFTFNPKFTDENAACMIIGENIFAMLLVEGMFSAFIPGKGICSAENCAEVVLAFSAESRGEADDMLEKVIAAGGTEYRKAEDHGWMYGRSFQDINGHIWEIFYMDESRMPEEMKNRK